MRLRELDGLIQATFEKIDLFEKIPIAVFDIEDLIEIAELTNGVIRKAICFPERIPIQTMTTCLSAKRILSRIQAWVWAEMLEESPYYDISQAVRYLGFRNSKQIYSAREHGKLKGCKAGKELRFTQAQLDDYMMGGK